MLLGEMVQGMGVNVKEYVVALLPVVMGLMGDALDEVGKGAARVFARLVRVAPLVEEGEGLDGVIEHLIRGKKLPRVRVGERVKRGMKGVLLRKYQEEGVTWLNFLMSVNLNGVLSDEMGLGKTLQSLIAVAMRHDGWENGEEANNTKAVSLIVCPSTLVNHWVNEVRHSTACFSRMLSLACSSPHSNSRFARAIRSRSSSPRTCSGRLGTREAQRRERQSGPTWRGATSS